MLTQLLIRLHHRHASHCCIISCYGVINEVEPFVVAFKQLSVLAKMYQLNAHEVLDPSSCGSHCSCLYEFVVPCRLFSDIYYMSYRQKGILSCHGGCKVTNEWKDSGIPCVTVCRCRQVKLSCAIRRQINLLYRCITFVIQMH